MSAAQIDITNTAAASDWDWFVNAHPEATGYHLSAWRDVFQTAFGHQTEYLSASRSGRITGVLPLVELLGAFYPVFAENMRDLGTPVYGRRFFEQILAHVGTDARVFVVTLERKPVAASITIGYRGKLEVPWSSSLKQYRMLNANTLLYWEMLKWAIEHRFHTFDFGRSTPNDGPYQFKAQWKAQPHPLSWEYALVNGSTMPDQSPKNPKFSLAIRLWQRLPVSVATTLGPSIVRSIP
ncbi:MAG: GNAT family N-acetyltransferase [Acidobacteria bacterium]|nr:GNAT family N-acetyltransferase [Acidobacteriota bacterium]